jgi:hypothetical protein
MVLYLCVLIVFSLHRESLKLILVDEPPPQGGSITPALDHKVARYHDPPHCLNCFGSSHFTRRCKALPDLRHASFIYPRLPSHISTLPHLPAWFHPQPSHFPLALLRCCATTSPPTESMAPGDHFIVGFPNQPLAKGHAIIVARGGGIDIQVLETTLQDNHAHHP